MIWVLKSGWPWRDMLDRYGSWKSVYNYFRRWSGDGTIDKFLERLAVTVTAGQAHESKNFASARLH